MVVKVGVDWVRTFEMALVRVGLGAVLFAPKRRFMVSLEISRVELCGEL
jgi:hypothetical protein